MLLINFISLLFTNETLKNKRYPKLNKPPPPDYLFVWFVCISFASIFPPRQTIPFLIDSNRSSWLKETISFGGTPHWIESECLYVWFTMCGACTAKDQVCCSTLRHGACLFNAAPPHVTTDGEAAARRGELGSSCRWRSCRRGDDWCRWGDARGTRGGKRARRVWLTWWYQMWNEYEEWGERERKRAEDSD